jgi:chorismate synthase
MLRYLTAGESHGPGLSVIIDGLPAGLPLKAEQVDFWLAERQKGYGRGGRMAIEKDRVRITGGVRSGRSLGSPLSLWVENKDWPNWTKIMDPAANSASHVQAVSITRPRPGHADLGGGLKYGLKDLRDVLERASARETTMRVAAGAVALRLLEELGVTMAAHVVRLGGVALPGKAPSFADVASKPFQSEVRCVDPAASAAMIKRIEQAKKAGDSLGGVFEIRAQGLPPGLGAHVQWDRKTDGRLARALMSIQSVKAVEIGLGLESADRPGSEVHDAIAWKPRRGREGYHRLSNNAGGIEGGMTNGEELVLRAAMKPIPTLLKPLRSVDMADHKAYRAKYERSDVCTVPAGAVVGLAVAAFELADLMLEKFGGDSLPQVKRSLAGYWAEISKR